MMRAACTASGLVGGGAVAAPRVPRTGKKARERQDIHSVESLKKRLMDLIFSYERERNTPNWKDFSMICKELDQKRAVFDGPFISSLNVSGEEDAYIFVMAFLDAVPNFKFSGEHLRFLHQVVRSTDKEFVSLCFHRYDPHAFNEVENEPYYCCDSIDPPQGARTLYHEKGLSYTSLSNKRKPGETKLPNLRGASLGFRRYDLLFLLLNFADNALLDALLERAKALGVEPDFQKGYPALDENRDRDICVISQIALQNKNYRAVRILLNHGARFLNPYDLDGFLPGSIMQYFTVCKEYLSENPNRIPEFRSVVIDEKRVLESITGITDDDKRAVEYQELVTDILSMRHSQVEGESPDALPIDPIKAYLNIAHGVVEGENPDALLDPNKAYLKDRAASLGPAVNASGFKLKEFFKHKGIEDFYDAKDCLQDDNLAKELKAFGGDIAAIRDRLEHYEIFYREYLGLDFYEQLNFKALKELMTLNMPADLIMKGIGTVERFYDVVDSCEKSGIPSTVVSICNTLLDEETFKSYLSLPKETDRSRIDDWGTWLRLVEYVSQSIPKTTMQYKLIQSKINEAKKKQVPVDIAAIERANIRADIDSVRKCVLDAIKKLRPNESLSSELFCAALNTDDEALIATAFERFTSDDFCKQELAPQENPIIAALCYVEPDGQDYFLKLVDRFPQLLSHAQILPEWVTNNGDPIRHLRLLITDYLFLVPGRGDELFVNRIKALQDRGAQEVSKPVLLAMPSMKVRQAYLGSAIETHRPESLHRLNDMFTEEVVQYIQGQYHSDQMPEKETHLLAFRAAITAHCEQNPLEAKETDAHFVGRMSCLEYESISDQNDAQILSGLKLLCAYQCNDSALPKIKELLNKYKQSSNSHSIISTLDSGLLTLFYNLSQYNEKNPQTFTYLFSELNSFCNEPFDEETIDLATQVKNKLFNVAMNNGKSQVDLFIAHNPKYFFKPFIFEAETSSWLMEAVATNHIPGFDNAISRLGDEVTVPINARYFLRNPINDGNFDSEIVPNYRTGFYTALDVAVVNRLAGMQQRVLHLGAKPLDQELLQSLDYKTFSVYIRAVHEYLNSGQASLQFIRDLSTRAQGIFFEGDNKVAFSKGMIDVEKACSNAEKKAEKLFPSHKNYYAQGEHLYFKMAEETWESPSIAYPQLGANDNEETSDFIAAMTEEEFIVLNTTDWSRVFLQTQFTAAQCSSYLYLHSQLWNADASFLLMRDILQSPHFSVSLFCQVFPNIDDKINVFKGMVEALKEPSAANASTRGLLNDKLLKRELLVEMFNHIRQNDDFKSEDFTEKAKELREAIKELKDKRPKQIGQPTSTVAVNKVSVSAPVEKPLPVGSKSSEAPKKAKRSEKDKKKISDKRRRKKENAKAKKALTAFIDAGPDLVKSMIGAIQVILNKYNHEEATFANAKELLAKAEEKLSNLNEMPEAVVTDAQAVEAAVVTENAEARVEGVPESVSDAAIKKKVAQELPKKTDRGLRVTEPAAAVNEVTKGNKPVDSEQKKKTNDEMTPKEVHDTIVSFLSDGNAASISGLLKKYPGFNPHKLFARACANAGPDCIRAFFPALERSSAKAAYFDGVSAIGYLRKNRYEGVISDLKREGLFEKLNIPEKKVPQQKPPQAEEPPKDQPKQVEEAPARVAPEEVKKKPTQQRRKVVNKAPRPDVTEPPSELVSDPEKLKQIRQQERDTLKEMRAPNAKSDSSATAAAAAAEQERVRMENTIKAMLGVPKNGGQKVGGVSKKAAQKKPKGGSKQVAKAPNKATRQAVFTISLVLYKACKELVRAKRLIDTFKNEKSPILSVVQGIMATHIGTYPNKKRGKKTNLSQVLGNITAESPNLIFDIVNGLSEVKKCLENARQRINRVKVPVTKLSKALSNIDQEFDRQSERLKDIKPVLAGGAGNAVVVEQAVPQMMVGRPASVPLEQYRDIKNLQDAWQNFEQEFSCFKGKQRDLLVHFDALLQRSGTEYKGAAKAVLESDFASFGSAAMGETFVEKVLINYTLYLNYYIQLLDDLSVEGAIELKQKAEEVKNDLVALERFYGSLMEEGARLRIPMVFN